MRLYQQIQIGNTIQIQFDFDFMGQLAETKGNQQNSG